MIENSHKLCNEKGHGVNKDNKGKSPIPSLFNDPEVLSSASDKTKLLKTFLRICMTQVSLYLLSLLKLI